MSKIDLPKLLLLTKNFVLIMKNYGLIFYHKFLFCYDIFLLKNLKLIFGCYYMTTNDNDFLAKISNNFCCVFCDYTTSRKYNFNIHLQSERHKNNKIDNENNINSAKISKYECQNCSKIFNDRAGLWRHKKKCNYNIEPIKKLTELDKDELIITLLKQNAELIKGQQDMMIKLTENGTHNTTNNTNTTHTNSHNKSFNLNLFLNETCKNAMNITDFVDSIKLQLNDLMEVGELGYVEGISKIIVKNLNNLDETERPIHCTDKKRETMYVKDEGEWNKEDDNKTNLKKVITKVADKNIRLLPQFREKYPEYKNSSSKTSDKYDKMVVEAMTSDEDKNEKIIKNISKVTTIQEKF